MFQFETCPASSAWFLPPSCPANPERYLTCTVNVEPPLASRHDSAHETETVLHRFTGGSDGGWPTGDLVFDSAGSIYGTTAQGGLPGGQGFCDEYSNNGCGTVFKLTNSMGSWTETVLYAFGTQANDGSWPTGGVVAGPDGNLYGVVLGEVADYGYVFQLKSLESGWTENILHNFQFTTEGGAPEAGLIVDASGNLYGTTSQGGQGYGGTAFELALVNGNWTFTLLNAFPFDGTGGPWAGLSMASAGNLYGTASGVGSYPYGSVFKLAPRGGGTWTYTDLYDFTGGSDGRSPQSAPVIDASGNLFGTTLEGGVNGRGVVFQITPH